MDSQTKLLIEHEGFELRPYKCTSGKWTWGIGRNFQDNPPTTEELVFVFDHFHDPAAVALHLLSNDVKNAKADLRTLFPKFDTFTENRRNALVSMRFMGAESFRSFKKMRAAVNAEDWKKAAEELLDSKYARKDCPVRAHDIARMFTEA